MPGKIEPQALVSLLHGFLELFFPPQCLLCGKFLRPGSPGDPPLEADLCPDCRSDFHPLPETHCLCCGRPFKTTLPSVHTCAQCRKKTPLYDQALSAGLYKDSLRAAVHRFKYTGRTELARPLAAFMAEHLGPPFFPPQADLILPVPLHHRRLRQRGFNQALLLTRALFQEWKKKIRHDLLLRTRWTEPQVNLKGPDRLRNVRRAFAVSASMAVKNRSIMIVDDVYTTGATANECAKVLKKAGASEVLVLTLAHVA